MFAAGGLTNAAPATRHVVEHRFELNASLLHRILRKAEELMQNKTISMRTESGPLKWSKHINTRHQAS
jgi:hypothetical protein